MVGADVRLLLLALGVTLVLSSWEGAMQGNAIHLIAGGIGVAVTVISLVELSDVS